MKKSDIDGILGRTKEAAKASGQEDDKKGGVLAEVAEWLDDKGAIGRHANTYLDFVGHGVKGLVKGAEGIYDAGAGVVGAVGGIFDSDFKDDVGEHIKHDYTGEWFDELGFDEVSKKSYLEGNKVGEFAREAWGAVGNMLPSVGLSFIPAAGPAIAMAYTGASAGGQAMESALDKGAGYYSSLAYGTGVGAVEAVTEKIGGRVFGEGASLTGKLLAGTKLGKFTSKGLGKVAETFVSEAAEEALADLADPALQYVTGVDKNIGENYKSVANGLPKTMLLGGTVGSILQGGNVTARALVNSERGGFKATRADEAMSYIGEVAQNYGKDVNKNAKYDKAINDALNDISRELTSMSPEARKNYTAKMGAFKNAFNAEDGSIKMDLRANINEGAVSNGLRGISGVLAHKPVSYDTEISEGASKAKTVVEKLLGDGANVVITSDKAQNNAFYNPDEGIVYINNNAEFKGEEIGEFVATHEVAHITEGTKEYISMQNLLEEIAKDQNAPQAVKDKIGNVAERQIEIGERYKSQMGNMSPKQIAYLIRTELNADLAGVLLGDDYFIEKLAQRDASLVKKIFNHLKGLTKKSTTIDKGSAKYLDKLVSKFGKAIDKSQGGVRISQIGREDEEQSIEVENERRSVQKYDYTKSFAEQIEDYKNGKFPKNDTFIVGKTPDVLVKIGLSELPMTITQKHIDYALNGTKNIDHHIGDVIKQLPSALENPVAIIASQSSPKTSVVVIVSLQHQNNQIIAPIYVSGRGTANGLEIDSNAVTSVHARKNAISVLLQNAVKNEANGRVGLFYWNKKEAIKLMTSIGVTMPQTLSLADGFIHSIHEKGSPVNINVKKITETKQFKRFFGDWQNNPEGASKVVNADGTPRVVYHGSNQEFSIFDLQMSGKNFGETSQGFFFFTSEKSAYPNSATDYANEMSKKGGTPKVYECYLSIKNPLRLDSKGYYDTVSYFDANHEKIYEQYLSGDYDGVIIENSNKSSDIGVLYLVDDSTQVKSATENIGTFDKDNPDIRYSISKNGKFTHARYTQMSQSEDLIKELDKIDENTFTAEEAALRLGELGYTTGIDTDNVWDMLDSIRSEVRDYATSEREAYRESNKKGGQSRTPVPTEDNELLTEEDANKAQKESFEALIENDPDTQRYRASEQARKESEESLLNGEEGKLKTETRYENDNATNEERFEQAERARKESEAEYTSRKGGYTGRGKVGEFILEAIDNSGVLENLDEDVAFVGKDAQKKILSVLFRRVNASDEYNKISFSNYIAKKIIENVVLGEGKVFKAEARLRGIMHKIDISSVEEKISKRDKLKFASRWKLREGEQSISISDAAKELNDLGYQIPMTDELQMLEEINKVYENTREYIENEMGDYLTKRMGEKEYASTKKKLADEIFAFLEENQTENALAGKLSFMVNKHQRALEKYREYRKEFKVDEKRVHIEMAIVHLVRQIKTDIKNHTYTPAQQPRFDEFKGIISLIAKLEVRGNINRSSAKTIIAELSKWYTKENELLADAFSEGVREDITYFKDSENKEKLLSISELYKLSGILAHLKNVFVNFGKIYRAGEWVELSEVAVSMYENCLEATKSDTGFSSLLRRGQYFESPLAVAAMLDGHVRGEFTRYVEDLQHGQLNIAIEKMKIAEKIEDFFKKDRKLFNSLVSGKLKVKCGIKVDLRSETMIEDVEIPAVNLVNLYLCTRTMSPEDFTLEKVGYAVKADNSGKYQYMAPISREEIEKAYNTLPESVKELAMWIQNWNNTEGKKMKYEQDIRLNGVSNVISGDYWHLKRLHFEGTNDMEKLFGSRGIGNHGFNKERIKQSSSMLVVDNFIEAFLTHTEELFQYKYIDITIKNFDKIVQANVNTNPNGANKNEGFRSVKMLIEEQGFYHGTIAKDKTALDYMTQLGKDVLKVDKNSDPFNAIIGNMRAGYASFVLGANVKVWATQFSSLIAGFGELRADSVLYGGANILRIFNPKSIAKLAQEVDEYCEWAKVRHFEKGATKAMTLTDKIGKWRGIFTKPIELFDRFIVMLEYLACQNEAQKRFGLKIGTEENKIKAGELLTEVGLKTQQNQYESTKSAAIRSRNEIMKGLVMFKTDSHMVLSGLIKELSALSVLNKKIKLAEKDGDAAKIAELKKLRNQAGKKTAKYATVVLLSCAYMTLLARLFNRFYEQDEDDEMTVGDICLDLFSNFLGMFPILSEIGSFLIDGYDVDNSIYSSVNNALGAVDKTIDLFKKSITGNQVTSEEAASAFRNDIYAVGQIFGMPAKNLYKNTKWVIGWFAPNVEDRIDSWFKEPSEKELEEKIVAGIEKGDEKAVSTSLDLLYGKYDLKLDDAVLRREYDRLMTLEMTKGEDNETKYTPLEAKIPDSIKIDDEEVELMQKDVSAFKNAFYEAEKVQAKTVKTVPYKKLSDEQRAYALRKISQYYYENTRYTYTGEKSNFAYYAKVVGVESLALILAYAKDLKGDARLSRRQKIEAYIRSLHLNSVQTSLALRCLGYGDKENDKVVASYVSRASVLTKEERAEMLEIIK